MVEASGRRIWLARAMNQVQSAATVGASSESRCQRTSGPKVFFTSTSWVVAATG